MKIRRLLSSALVFIMLFALVPAASLAADIEAFAAENEAMHKLDEVWAVLDAVEADVIASGADRADIINTVYEAALNLDSVNADSFSDFTEDGFLFTVDGMYCAYNFKLRNELHSGAKPAGDRITTIKGNGEGLFSKDAGSPDILLVGPYYGYDDSFDDSYENVAATVANATGGSLSIIEGHAATGPAIAAAFPNYGVILVDSHGSAYGSSTYICLTTNQGITSTDYQNGWAISDGSAAWIDGRYIQHYTNTSALSDANPFVWLGICEGMKASGHGTTGYALLNAGCGAVYGYSQSVSFTGDLTMYLPSFWSSMNEGATVAEAFQHMKNEYGVPDPVNNRAYPIIMSDVDPFPANPDSAQTVYCEWTLFGNTEPVELTSFSLSPADIELFVGRTAEINFIREPDNANAYELIWTSDNEAAAIVTGSKNKRKAIVTGVGEGSAVITCTVMVGGQVFGSADVDVTVSVDRLLCSALNVEGGTLQFGTSEPYGFDPFEADGRNFAKSTNRHVINSTATLTTVIEMEADETLSFDYFYSTESGKDWYTFTVNDVQKQHLSGTVPTDWKTYTFTAPSAGVYTFVWAYTKDKGTSVGEDCVKIDNVEYSGDPGEAVTADGDVNLDGITDITDALTALRYAMGMITISDEQILHGDLDGNGTVTAIDAVAILRLTTIM